MSGMTVVIFAFSAVLFTGGIHFLLSMKKPGVYPPKYILKKRAAAFGAGGAAFLLLGIIMQTLL